MQSKGKILIVDDNEDVLLSLNMLLRPNVGAVRVTTNPERIFGFMDDFKPDVILLDMNFRRDSVSGEEGYQWLERILEKNPCAVVLFITAYVDTEKAVRAIKAGAVDFIPKPWNKNKLLGVVESAIELSVSRHSETPKIIEKPAIKKEKTAEEPIMIGASPAIETLRQQIARVAKTDANVLVTGENGTGKDVVARLLHHHSKRIDKPFVAIDLGTVPEHLFEGELFGYEKGAFTNAHTAKAGRIETADGGTLFLDEIGNLTPAMQLKLLTVIEKRELSRLGATKTKHVDIRIIAATNADLQKMVSENTFRQDLLYRINTIELRLPPLRQRGNDIILLAEYFAEKIAEKYEMPSPRISADARKRLLKHTWPGNVRELQHVMERAIVLSGKEILTSEDIPIDKSTTQQQKETLNLETIERQAIMRAIETSNGNLTQAAELLGITRYALYRKIEKLNIKQTK